MKEKRYTISEASRLLDVENHVLRYWEEELELEIPRNELGHRFYREEEIQLLTCIKELKNKGFQLKAVKEVLPDLREKRLIDVHKLLASQEELGPVEEQEEEEAAQRYRYEDEEEEESETNLQIVPNASKEIVERSREDKMKEFENIMTKIVGRALKEQAEVLGDSVGNQVAGRVMKDMDELLEEREEKEEYRYRKLDEAIRNHQKARQDIAVARDGTGRKKSLFFKKNKRKI